mmetsp:Transcript_112457/g.350485  ORF Transcript_112457/g.350485 Transcript_112457/m.350485 type:complete len:218 (-) Transcript_112457:241-894(-)
MTITLATRVTARPNMMRTSATRVGYSRFSTDLIRLRGISKISDRKMTALDVRKCMEAASVLMKMRKAVQMANCPITTETWTMNLPLGPTATMAISPKLVQPVRARHCRSRRMHQRLTMAMLMRTGALKAQPPLEKASGRNVTPLPTKLLSMASAVCATPAVPLGGETSAPVVGSRSIPKGDSCSVMACDRKRSTKELCHVAGLSRTGTPAASAWPLR